MVSVHLPSKEDIEIVKLKERLKDQLTRVIANEEEQMRIIQDLAKKMIKTSKEKRILVDLEEKLLEAEKIATKNPISNIKSEEISVLKKNILSLSNSLENQQELADSFLDLSSSMKEFLNKKKEYNSLLKNLLIIQKKWQDNVYRYMKAKNKMYPEKKTRPMELKIGDLEGKMRRLQAQTDRRIESLMEEVNTLNRAWQDVKSSIKSYGW